MNRIQSCPIRSIIDAPPKPGSLGGAKPAIGLGTWDAGYSKMRYPRFFESRKCKWPN
jgi:hypothetical protein